MFSYYAFPPRVKQCLANTVLLTKRLHREPALLMLRNQLLPIFQSTDRCFAAHLSNIRFLAPFRHWGLQAAYEYVPASLTVIEEACLKYACACTVRTAGKPPQPIEKSIAGASLLAQVIVSKWADHLPLYRQEQIFARYGVALSRKSMGGWMAQCAALLKPLYVAAKEVLFGSKVIGTDDTSVKVLDRKLPFARTGRIWPYYGDQDHPVTRVARRSSVSNSHASPAESFRAAPKAVPLNSMDPLMSI